MKKLFLIFCLGFCQTIFAQSSVNDTKAVVTNLNMLFSEKDVWKIEVLPFSKFYKVSINGSGEVGVIGIDGKWLIKVGKCDIEILHNLIDYKTHTDSTLTMKTFSLVDGKEIGNIELKKNQNGKVDITEEGISYMDAQFEYITGIKGLGTKYVIDNCGATNEENGFTRDGYVYLSERKNWEKKAIVKNGKIFYHSDDDDFIYLGNDLFMKEEDDSKNNRIFTFEAMCASSLKP